MTEAMYPTVGATAADGTAGPRPVHTTSHAGQVRRRFLHQPIAVAALIFLFLVVALAIFAPLISRYPPNYQILQDRYSGISWDHWLGTDNLGRDTFARLAYGARTSMLITFGVAFLATLIAVPIGLISGHFSGRVDVVVQRLTEALMSIPPLVMALAIAGILGPGTRNVMIALIVVMVPGLVRLVRAQTLAVREESYVEASKAIGTPSRMILARRVFPHVLSPLLVQVSVALGSILVVEASLSFLGLGDPPPNASWGSMLQDGFQLMATDARLILVPSIAIALTILAFNAVGDSLSNAVQDSGGQRRRRGDAIGTTTVLDVGGRSESQRPRSDAVLSVRSLSVGFDSGDALVQVLDDVSLEVCRGEILGLVGESGCGKTVTAQSILRLLPSPPARILGGEICFEGEDLLRMSKRELRHIRGRDIAMVFQDPMRSLNPAFTVGDQIVEAQRVHHKISKSAARRRAAELLDLVGIPDAGHRLEDYPHTFSGGMRQRAMIAMALANDPKLLVADEPTTALDVTVQAQVIELIGALRRELGMSVLFVTHNLGLVQDLCDRVAVMYAGQVVEQASAAQIFANPRHPYSAALLRSRPSVAAMIDRLPSIPGVVPAPAAMPKGCRFHDRCDFAVDRCLMAPIALVELGTNQLVRCIRHDEIDLSPLSKGSDSPKVEALRP
jgi:peptide/nickel transport system permease protein